MSLEEIRAPWTERIPWEHGMKTDTVELPASMSQLLDNNEVPSAQAIGFTLEYRRTCTARLAQTEQRLEAGNANEQWLTEELELRRKIHLCKIILSPLRRVPLEILQEIFTHCMADYSPSRFALCLVCSTWRQLLLSMPHYWSHIQLNIKPSSSLDRVISQIETSAKKARYLPLSISLSNHKSNPPASYTSTDDEDDDEDDDGEYEETCCGTVITRLLSDLSLAKRISHLSLLSKSPVFSPTILPPAGYPSGSGLTQLRTLALSPQTWGKDFDIDFSDDYLQVSHCPGDIWPADLLAGATSLRRVSFGQQALTSVRLSEDFPWAQLTHVFMEPVVSEYGWWDVLQQCPNLITGYFFVSHSWPEYDGCDFDALTLPKVEEMSLAFVDYGRESCLKAIPRVAMFPNLKRFGLHVNEHWDTEFDPLSLAEEMPRMKVLSIAQSWTLCHHRNDFLRMFSDIQELELGVRLSDSLETFRFLTAPDPSSGADTFLPRLLSITIEVQSRSGRKIRPEETRGFVTMVKSRRSDAEHEYCQHQLKSARLYFLENRARPRYSSPSPSPSTSTLLSESLKQDVRSSPSSPDTSAEISRSIREQLESLTDRGLELEVGCTQHSFGSYAYRWEQVWMAG